MKNDFEMFYRYSKEQFDELWNSCIFVFDTNILLNLYRYSEATKFQLISVMHGFKSRIWIPHQTGLEFHFNRLSVLIEQKDAYNNINNILMSFAADTISELGKKLNSYKKQHPTIDIRVFTEKIENAFNDITDEIKLKEASHPDLLQDDSIFAELTNLFEGQIGASYDQEKLNEIFKSGEDRYQKKIPPGYEDEKEKKDNKRYYKNIEIIDKFGDLIVWNQILDKSKADRIPIIFVTGDSKEDWWQKVRGRTIGPRPELLNEFYTKTNQLFYMYQPDKFIEYAQELLKQDINKEAIQEIQDLRKSDEEKKNLTEFLVWENKDELKEDTTEELSNIFDIEKLEQDYNEYLKNKSRLYNNLPQRLKGSLKNTEIDIGDTVKHSRWGLGLVLNTNGEGMDKEGLVAFSEPVGLKKLLLAFAPISIVK